MKSLPTYTTSLPTYMMSFRSLLPRPRSPFSATHVPTETVEDAQKAMLKDTRCNLSCIQLWILEIRSEFTKDQLLMVDCVYEVVHRRTRLKISPVVHRNFVVDRRLERHLSGHVRVEKL